jgi:hypothetical protein
MHISKILKTNISKVGLLASSGLIATALLVGVPSTASATGYGRGGDWDNHHNNHHRNYHRHNRDCYRYGHYGYNHNHSHYHNSYRNNW